MRFRRLIMAVLVATLIVTLSIGVVAAKQKIKFWHIWDGGDAQAWIKETVKEFNASQAEIEVEELGINFWDYWSKIATATAAGIAPDLAMNDLGNVPQRASVGMIEPLDAFMERDGVSLDEFWPATHRAITWEGKVYGMPWETDVRVFYYNKEAFKEVGLDPEKPPATWDELVQYSDLLTKRDENGKLIRVGFSPTWGNSHFWTLAWLNGGRFTDDEGNIQIYNEKNVETLEWIQQRLKAYGIRDLTSFSSSFGGGAMNPFMVGKVAMIIETNSFRGTVLRYAPDLKFGVAPLPHNGTPASWSNGFSLEISSQSKNKEATWKFLKYLMSKEVQTEYALVNSSLVGNIAAATNEKLMQDESWRVIIDTMRVSKFRPFSLKVPTWYDVCLTPELQAVQEGLKDAESALKQAQKSYEDEVKRYDRTHRN